MPLDRLFPRARIQAMREHLERFAAGFGVTGMGRPERLPNTRRALAIAELARERGVLDAYREAAMDAHWREGLDLERDEDLAKVAAAAGLDGAEAVAASHEERWLEHIDAVREEAEALGVTGIPTFFFEDVPVVGCQPYEVLARAARLAGARPRQR